VSARQIHNPHVYCEDGNPKSSSTPKTPFQNPFELSHPRSVYFVLVLLLFGSKKKLENKELMDYNPKRTSQMIDHILGYPTLPIVFNG
jgi:hypothetical protein